MYGIQHSGSGRYSTVSAAMETLLVSHGDFENIDFLVEVKNSCLFFLPVGFEENSYRWGTFTM